MKKGKRLFCMLLALAVVSALFAGCQSQTSGAATTGAATTTTAAAADAPASTETAATTTAATTAAAADAPTEAAATTAAATEAPTEAAAAGIAFPLAEPVTFSFMSNGAVPVELLQGSALWKKLTADNNISIDITVLGTEGINMLNILFSGGTYGDAIFGANMVGTTAASQYAASGLLADLTPYITPEIMPNFYAILEEEPAMWGNIRAADGKIYALPKITGLAGEYLESPLMVNKQWLDKLGLDIPKTQAEFTEMLRKFKTEDPNGNGQADEIPYMASFADSFAHLDVINFLYGVASKNSSLDGFVQIVGGKAQFAGVQPGYKESLKYQQQLYSEGLLWQDCFTAPFDQFSAKLTAEECVIGCLGYKLPNQTTSYWQDYVVMAPPKMDGYDAKWYYHPGYYGAKNIFFATDRCENLDVLMHWVDLFMDTETALQVEYGEIGDGWLEKGADGVYTINALNGDEIAALQEKTPTLTKIFASTPRAIRASAYGTALNLSPADQIKQNNYAVYKDYLNTELWPRPYYLPEDADRMGVLITDILDQVNVKRADWVTGKSDIDAEWDAYVQKLDELGLAEYLEIQQRAYDATLG
jgi:putative aldouronate transport system substrate-binding protein